MRPRSRRCTASDTRSMNRPLRVGIRTRLLVTVVGAVALALVLGVAAFNVLLDQRLSDSATSLARAQALAALSALDVVNGTVVPPEAPDEGARLGSPVWVFSGRKAVEAPRVDPSLTAAVLSLADGPERTLRVGEEIRLYALPVVDGDAQVGTVVAGVLSIRTTRRRRSPSSARSSSRSCSWVPSRCSHIGSLERLSSRFRA